MLDEPEVQDTPSGDTGGAPASTEDTSAPQQQSAPAAPEQAQPQPDNSVQTTVPTKADAPTAQPLPSDSPFDRVLQTIAGHPQTISRDAEGNPIRQDVTSRGTLAEHIVAAALLGLAKGAGAKPGPGHIGAGFSEGASAGEQIAGEDRAAQQQRYEQEQQAQIQRYQIAHLNAETSMNAANAQKVGMEALEKSADMNKDAVNSLAASGSIETDANGEPVKLTQSDVLAKIKSGELSAGDQIGMVAGGTLIGGKPQALYVVNKNPNAPVKVTQEQYDKWTVGGVNVPKEVVGQNIPAKSFSTYSNQALGHITSESVLGVLREDAGDNKELAAKIPQSVDVSTPGIGSALKLYQRALIGSKGDPLAALEIVQQNNKQAADILVNAFGGLGTLQELAVQRSVTASQATNPDRAKPNPDAVSAFVKNLPSYQLDAGSKKGDTPISTGLAQEAQNARTQKDFENVQTKAIQLREQNVQKTVGLAQASANRNIATDERVAKQVDELSTKGKDSYATFSGVNNELRENLAAAKNGDEIATAFAKTIGIQNVNNVADLARIPPTEYDKVENAGSVWRQISNAIIKAGNGTANADTFKELYAVADRARDSKYGAYLTSMQTIQKNQAPGKDFYVVSKDGKTVLPLSQALKNGGAGGQVNNGGGNNGSASGSFFGSGTVPAH